MTISLFDSQIYGPTFSDQVIAEIFSDRHRMTAMLDVERALARAQGRLGLIPEEHAQRIASVALTPDLDELGRNTRQHGVPVVELVRQLRATVGGEASDSVHFGATSQDIVDTAHVLQFRTALSHIEDRLDELMALLAGLADRHRHTVMPGRTRSQQAVPITFGLKSAGWLAPLVRHRSRLQELKPRLLVVQFGGAAGTLAALGEKGLEVSEALASELDLLVPTMPWHTQRDGFAELAGVLSMLTGSVGKMGQDLVLLAQSEVGEVIESPVAGGSSTMPNKTNPIGSETLIAVARLNNTLLSNVHAAMIAEHERATHGWQLEWSTLPQMLGCAGSALARATEIVQGLVVNEDVMARNVEESNGLLLAERAVFVLIGSKGRQAAQETVRSACQRAVAENRHLMDVLSDTEPSVEWGVYREPRDYLGASDALIDSVLASMRGP